MGFHRKDDVHARPPEPNCRDCENDIRFYGSDQIFEINCTLKLRNVDTKLQSLTSAIANVAASSGGSRKFPREELIETLPATT